MIHVNRGRNALNNIQMLVDRNNASPYRREPQARRDADPAKRARPLQVSLIVRRYPRFYRALMTVGAIRATPLASGADSPYRDGFNE
jgi:retron-type reverse transcriptase